MGVVMKIYSYINNKNLFKTIFLLFFLFFIFSSIITAQQYSDNKSEIELRKSEIELNKLIYEENFLEITFWVKTLGGIFGGIVAIGTIIYGLQTFSQFGKEQKLAKISSLLESSSSKSEYIRLAAIKGLIQYIDYVIDEMLVAISTEKSYIVRKAIENALYKINKKRFNKVVESNNGTLVDRSYLIGRLIKVGIKKEEIAARLMLILQSMKMIKDRFKIDYEYGKKIQKLHMERQAVLNNQNDLNNTTSFLFKKAELLSRLTESTGVVIARWIRDGRKINWPETGLDLSETNLYHADLKQINASHSIFSYCIMRHSNLKYSILSGSIFCFADLFGTCLDNANLDESDLTNCNLRSSSGKYANFNETNMSEAIFSEGDFSYAKFIGIKSENVKFKKSKLINVSFKDCILTKSEFHRANLEGSLFENTKLFRSIFIESNFRNSTIRDVEFNGANLRGADLRGANLYKVDFAGANIKNADFRGANIGKKVKFENCTGLDEAIFDDN